MIVNLMEIENANINTNHPDFVGSADCLLNLFQDDPAATRQEENADTEEPPEKTYSLLTKRKAPKEEELSGGRSQLSFDAQQSQSSATISKLKQTEKQLEMSQFML